MSDASHTRLKAAGALLGMAAVVGCAWFAPFSPLALSRADVAVGQGLPVLAVVRYDEVARYSPIASQREEALWRGGMIAAADLGDNEGALRRLRQLLAAAPDGRHAAEAWEQVGYLLVARDQPGQLGSADAAMAFAHSFGAAPDNSQAAGRLNRAARAYAEAGQLKRSDNHWKLLATTFPHLTAQSLVGQAENELLRKNMQEALALYESAIPHANDLNMRAVAKFGAAACLEHLGDLEEAIAALDGAELPAEVHDLRRRGIRDRREARGE